MTEATPRRAWRWLLVAAVLGLVSSGQWALVPAAWLSGVFTLRFARQVTPIRGYLALALVNVPVVALAWSMFPFGGTIGLLIFATIASFVGHLPFLLDRWLAPHAHGLWRTLVLPVAHTGLEFVGQMNDDFGSWGAAAYAHVDVPWLMQSASLVGLAGLAFVTTWFASVVNELWERDWNVRACTRPVAAWVTVMAMLVGYGAWRLSYRDEPSARAAAISAPRFGGLGDDALKARYRNDGPLSEQDRKALRTHHHAENERLMAAAAREAGAGAQLVVWAEAAAVVLDVEEVAFTARGQSLARDHDVTMAMAIAVLDSGEPPRKITNKLVLILPDGTVASQYTKAIPTPGSERAWSHRGNGELQVAETPLGRVAAVICYDLDFPGLIHQASEQQVDVLLVPAGDWPQVADMHAAMARWRAVEQGVVIIRPAAAGLSTAIDTRGRVLASHRWSNGADDTLVAQVPTQRSPTVYGVIGDAFGCANALGFGGLIVLGVAIRIRRGRGKDA